MNQPQDPAALLYGADPRPGLVGCAPHPAGMTLWWRRGDQVAAESIPYSPFFLLSHPELLDHFRPACQIEKLSGGNLYAWRACCDNWEHHDAALAHANAQYRADKAAFNFEPVLRISEPVNQFLLAAGLTHYSGLALGQLNVVYVALRALNSNGADYADPDQESDRIVALGLSDGRGWTELIPVAEGSEKQALAQFVQAVQRRDPDVIVGHDLFKGAMHYLAVRARRQRVKLALGRNGAPVTVRKSRAPAAEKQLEYPRADVAGRSLVDTWFLAQYFDIVKRDLERYDAPYVARYLDRSQNIPDPLPAWEVDRYVERAPAALLADLKYELQAAAQIFNTLGGSYFAQAQMLPFSLQDCVVRGNGVKINNLLLREYLRQRISIPAPVSGRTFAGGHTELRQTGLIHNVLNVDVASLYPSIMLTRGIKPASDTGGVFQALLGELTRQRLAAKQQARSATDVVTRVAADARQAAFKIFINSFFGYLGTDRMNWADPEQAELITTTGQEIVKRLAELVVQVGGQVIEIDTDGVYFTAPPGVVDEAGRDALVERLNQQLPAGIVVELGGYYPAMLSHKVKNYALLHEDGMVTVKGSGMKSRGLEPYLHGFIAYAIQCLLMDQPVEIDQRFADLKAAVENRSIDIRQLAKTDTLIEPLERYRQKINLGGRNRAAAYEVALRAARELRSGDQVSYYITGDKSTVKAFEAAKPIREYDPAHPDYNVKYYVKKLEENLKKVQGFLREAQANGLFDEPARLLDSGG